MDKIKVYLAGSVDETEYRKEVKEKYGNTFELIDPMDHISSDPAKTVLRDIEKIEQCNFLVAYIRKASFGTAIEIKYCHDRFIPGLVIDPTKKWRNDPWLAYHTFKFFDSIDDCFENFIMKPKKRLGGERDTTIY